MLLARIQGCKISSVELLFNSRDHYYVMRRLILVVSNFLYWPNRTYIWMCSLFTGCSLFFDVEPVCDASVLSDILWFQHLFGPLISPTNRLLSADKSVYPSLISVHLRSMELWVINDKSFPHETFCRNWDKCSILTIITVTVLSSKHVGLH